MLVFNKLRVKWARINYEIIKNYINYLFAIQILFYFILVHGTKNDNWLQNIVL